MYSRKLSIEFLECRNVSAMDIESIPDLVPSVSSYNETGTIVELADRNFSSLSLDTNTVATDLCFSGAETQENSVLLDDKNHTIIINGVSYQVPDKFHINTFLPPKDGEALIYFGGKNLLNSQPSIVTFDLRTLTFNILKDLSLVFEATGEVVELVRLFDDSDRPNAIIRITREIDGRSFIGSVSPDDQAIAQFIGPSESGMIYSEMGTTVFTDSDNRIALNFANELSANIIGGRIDRLSLLEELCHDKQITFDSIVRVTSLVSDGLFFTKIRFIVLRDAQEVEVLLDYKSNSPYQNQKDAHDVNGDGVISAEDSNLIISQINSLGNSGLSVTDIDRRAEQSASRIKFIDTNGDNIVSALDVLRVINALNRNSS